MNKMHNYEPYAIEEGYQVLIDEYHHALCIIKDYFQHANKKLVLKLIDDTGYMDQASSLQVKAFWVLVLLALLGVFLPIVQDLQVVQWPFGPEYQGCILQWILVLEHCFDRRMEGASIRQQNKNTYSLLCFMKGMQSQEEQKTKKN